MTILQLPKREVTTPPVEHTITVRLSSAGATFLQDGVPISMERAATIITLMAQVITRSLTTVDSCRPNVVDERQT